jgi:hypothetical protein
MTRAMKMIHFPVTRLSELVARNGGVTREHAVEEAKKSIEGLRDLALETIEAALKEIETAVYGAKRRKLDSKSLREILMQADHIVTMTGTFGLETLECATKSLCDVVDGMMTRGSDDAAPVMVHVQTMRLLAPGSMVLNEEQVQHLLGELTKVRTHFHFTPLAPAAPAQVGPAEV